MKCVYGISFLLLLLVGAFVCQASPIKIEQEQEINTDSESAEVDDAVQRERRQMKSGTNAAESDVKTRNIQDITPTTQVGPGGAGLPNNSAQQFSFNNPQFGRYPQFPTGAAGFMLNGYGGGLPGIPNAGYPNAGLNQAYPGGNLPSAPLYPGNMNANFYPGYTGYPNNPDYMFGGAQAYPPNVQGQGQQGQVPSNFLEQQNAQNFGNLGHLGNMGHYGNYGNTGTLDNLVNMVNMQGVQGAQGVQGMQGLQQSSPIQYQQLAAQQSQLQPQIAGYPLMQGYYPQMGYSPSFQNYQG